MNTAPNPNHGIWMPLRRDWPCTDWRRRDRYIAVRAYYNAIGEADTAWGLARIECRWEKARHIVWLRGEHLSGRKAAGCRRDLSDDQIEVSFLVLRKTDETILQWIEIGANLMTTRQSYPADMRVFRRVLRGIWIHPDGPHR